MITQEYLKSILHYNPETGIFTWKVNVARAKKDTIAGGFRNDGYHRIKINTKRYLSHRLAWLYVYGEFPNGNIDHINVNPSDNRISNLRIATASQNSINKKLSANNKSKFKGVHFVKSKNKWMARITINRKKIYLGIFKDIKDAALAYKEAAIKYHKNFINMDGVINE